MKAIPSPVMQRIQTWLEGPYDEKTKEEIRQKLRSDPEDLIDAFFTDLSFGTGGMRGLMGVGTSRLNPYTIRMATQGLAQYLNKKSKKPSVLIGFDSRIHSKEFAEDAACVLAGNGIHVYLLPEIRPTPYISFASRYKKCDAAIMITASHNPKEYNGYKVYNRFGGQVIHPEDSQILKEVLRVLSISQVKMASLDHPSIEIVDLR
ncbi:MAG: phospho-sugar mutase, partial [Chlamydiales bacterium]|nr:phospho-sugar mutase [Chlamydiales bacterium]